MNIVFALASIPIGCYQIQKIVFEENFRRFFVIFPIFDDIVGASFCDACSGIQFFVAIVAILILEGFLSELKRWFCCFH
jgi:hypothetical protein